MFASLHVDVIELPASYPYSGEACRICPVMQAHFSLVSNFGGEKLKVVAVLLQFFCTAHGCCLGRCQLAAHINIDSGVALLARSTGRAWQKKKKKKLVE